MNRESPILVSIKDRFRLNHPLSNKETYHVILDLSQFELNYEVGDCVGIYPVNENSQVSSILSSIKATGSETIVDRDGCSHLLKDFLKWKSNLTRVSKKFCLLICERLSNGSKKDILDKILNSSQKEELRTFLESYQIWDFLNAFPPQQLTPQELCDHLSPLLPRLYSIASSMKEVGKEVHLVIGLTEYHSNEQKRLGVCSHFLCHSASLHSPEVPIYLHPAKEFKLSQDSFSKPIIMIGPGTGVAPFRGFIQERMLHPSQQKNWLFFGERHAAYDFYYEDYWKDLVARGSLRLDVAFSRDQGEKIYVQHRMRENAVEIWQWLQEGAYIYVCGDASKMAKEVEATLYEIIKNVGSLTDDEAKNFLKELKSQKRYLKDVY